LAAHICAPNPQAKSIFELVAYLQKIEERVLEVIDRAAA
jgi:hypothetical protein